MQNCKSMFLWFMSVTSLNAADTVDYVTYSLYMTIILS